MRCASRVTLGVLTSLTTAALLAVGTPLAANAATPDLYLEVQHPTLTIPYGGKAPSEQVLIATDDYNADTGADVAVDVDLVNAAGIVRRLASAVDLAVGPDTPNFPNAPYHTWGAVVTVPGADLVTGGYTVRATPVESGTEYGTATSVGFRVVTAVAPAVKTVTTRRNIVWVFPARDGYRDSVTVTVGGTTTTGSPIRTTGTAVLKRGSRTVQTWSLTSSAARVTWNGRDHGRIVVGNYRLTVTQRGQTGAAHSASTTLTVDKRMLHSRTAVRHYSALSVLPRHYTDYSTGNYAECYTNQFQLYGSYVGGALFCEAYDDFHGGLATGTALSVNGSLAIPSVVRHATAFGRPIVTVGQHTWIMANAAFMRLSAGGNSYRARVGNGYTSHTMAWSGNPSRLGIAFQLGDYCWAGVKDYTVTWHYKVLS